MYSEMRDKYLNHEITEKAWNEYCTALLFEIIHSPECKDLLGDNEMVVPPDRGTNK